LFEEAFVFQAAYRYLWPLSSEKPGGGLLPDTFFGIVSNFGTKNAPSGNVDMDVRWIRNVKALRSDAMSRYIPFSHRRILR